MKEEKGFLFGIFVLSTVIFFGCASAIDLTETESNLIARYASGAILNQAEDYDGKLIMPMPNPKTIPNSDVMNEDHSFPENTPDVMANDQNINTPNEQDSKIALGMNEIFGISGLDFSCNSYDVYSEYKGGSFVANDQELVLVVDFKIKNTTTKSIPIDLVERNIEYPLEVESQSYKPEITLLPNGLNFINTKIKAGKTENAVLIYSVPKSVKSTSNVTLKIQDANKEAIILVNKK